MLIALALLYFYLPAAQVSGQVSPSDVDPNAVEFAPGVILVRFKQVLNRFQLSSIESDLDGEIAAEIPQIRWRVFRVPPGKENLALSWLRRNPLVAIAALDYQVKIMTLISPAQALQETNYCFPDSPVFEGQWALNLIGVPSVWPINSGSPDMIIGVIDTGIQSNHSDLLSQIWTNSDEIPGNLIDDDGNGKVDDVHGWHFYNSGFENNNVSDDNGHGTHTSGIISAANNGTGTTGVAYNSLILPVKALNQYGEGWASDIAAGIVYAVDNGAKIINLSLGTPLDLAVLKDAINYAISEGVIIVAAAGNDGTEGVDYPAKYPEVLAVAASDSFDQRASFSDYGPEIDVAAPGYRICSTWYRGNYFYQSGTSMAAPHAAGVAALIWSANPTMTAGQVEAHLKESAVDINASGWDIYTGWGRVSAINFFLPLRCYLPLINR